MACVHFIGEIRGARDVPAHKIWRLNTSQALWCRWELIVEDNGRWRKSDGARSHTSPNEPASVNVDNTPCELSEYGQTHVCVCDSEGEAVWSHPIDVQYTTTSLRGWPSIVLEVWAQDGGARNELAGYGVCNLPSAAGSYTLDVALWRPLQADPPGAFLSDPLGFLVRMISCVFARANGVFLGVWPRLHNDLNPQGKCEKTKAKSLIFETSIDEKPDFRKMLRTEGTGVVRIDLSVITRGFHKLGPGTNPKVDLEWEEELRRIALEKEEKRANAMSIK